MIDYRLIKKVNDLIDKSNLHDKLISDLIDIIKISIEDSQALSKRIELLERNVEEKE